MQCGLNGAAMRIVEMKLRNVEKGLHGPDVKAVQEGLNKHYAKPALVEDGQFGPNTDKLVRQFQKENGLQVDGTVGPVTRSALFPLVGVTLNFWGTRRSSPLLRGLPVPQLRQPSFTPVMPRMGQPMPKLQLTPPSFGQKTPTPQLILPMSAPLLASGNDLIQPAGLPDKVPVPKVATPPGGSIVVDWQQLAQTQRQFTGLFKNPQDSFAVGFQSVFKRQLLDPNARHLEIATGCLLQSPIGFTDAHGNDFTLACFAQATWVEPLGASGVFSWAPYAQVQGQGNTSGPLNATGTISGFPINFNIDLSKGGFNDVTLQLGVGAAGGLLFTPQGVKSTWGPQAGVGLTGKIWLLGQ